MLQPGKFPFWLGRCKCVGVGFAGWGFRVGVGVEFWIGWLMANAPQPKIRALMSLKRYLTRNDILLLYLDLDFPFAEMIGQHKNKYWRVQD